MEQQHQTGMASLDRFAVGAILPALIGVAAVAAPASAPPAAPTGADGRAATAVDPPFPLPEFKPPAIPDRRFNIRDFGAAEGGEKSNTAAIRAAIESASRAGGGVVIIPEGKWLAGPIQLDSNIELPSRERRRSALQPGPGRLPAPGLLPARRDRVLQAVAADPCRGEA